jgi:dTDP-4-dehydrorhamnose 3,5-epimerase
VRLLRLDPIEDARGSFVELFRQEAFPRPFVQANLSRSRPGVLRGMHYHLTQADLWIPVEGRATAGLLDLRHGSPARGRGVGVDLRPGSALYLPPGVAHGYCVTDAFVLLYLVDRAYDGSDEHGFDPRDPGLGVVWPVADPILSERDRTAPGLASALASAELPGWPG